MRRFVKGVLNDLVEGELPTQIACKHVESDGACLKTIIGDPSTCTVGRTAFGNPFSLIQFTYQSADTVEFIWIKRPPLSSDQVRLFVFLICRA